MKCDDATRLRFNTGGVILTEMPVSHHHASIDGNARSLIRDSGDEFCVEIPQTTRGTTTCAPRGLLVLGFG